MVNPKQAEVSLFKTHLPFVDLQGLTPEQSAFQRTHPQVRQQILDGMRGGNYQNWQDMAKIHKAQSVHDFARAQEGRRSPYTHPAEQQPYGNPSRNAGGTTMKLPVVQQTGRIPVVAAANPKLGDCYRQAYKALMKAPEGWTMMHGDMLSPLDRRPGGPFPNGHAVLLDTEGNLHDPVMGAQWPDGAWQHLYNFQAGARTFTKDQARQEALDHDGVAGPWHDTQTDYERFGKQSYYDEDRDEYLYEIDHPDYPNVSDFPPSAHGYTSQPMFKLKPAEPEYSPKHMDENDTITSGEEIFDGEAGENYLVREKRDMLEEAGHKTLAAVEPGRRLTWDEIGERHPAIYGDPEVHGEAANGADGEGVGWAAAHLAFDRPGHEEHDEGSWDLDFRLQDVPVNQIDYARHEPGDPRVGSARRWYRESPDEVVPPVLVHRHGVYQVADGHHRAEAAEHEGLRTIPAYVAQSPHENESFSDGVRAPYHGPMQRHAAAPEDSGLKAAGIAVIAMDTGRVLMLQRALNPLHCPCGQGVTWDEMNGYQHDDGSVSHDGEYYGQSVSDLLDQGHPEPMLCPCCLGRGDNDQGSECTSCDGSGSDQEEPSCDPPCREIDGLDKTSAIERDPNEGVWEFPGGCLDEGEPARTAAIREFREEVGQDLPPGVFVGAWVSPGGIVVSAAVANWFEDRKPAIKRPLDKELGDMSEIRYHPDDEHDVDPRWVRMVDPDHIDRSNPSTDPFIELKGMNDSGIPHRVNPSDGEVCEECYWNRNGLPEAFKPSHFEDYGHKPMIPSRYAAVTDPAYQQEFYDWARNEADYSPEDIEANPALKRELADGFGRYIGEDHPRDARYHLDAGGAGKQKVRTGTPGSTVRVLRVEKSDGTGPFAYGGATIPRAYEGDAGNGQDLYNLLNPLEEDDDPDRASVKQRQPYADGIPHRYIRGRSFGFLPQHKISDYFTPTMLKGLHDRGFGMSEYDVPGENLVLGRTQAAWRPEDATRVSHKSLLDHLRIQANTMPILDGADPRALGQEEEQYGLDGVCPTPGRGDDPALQRVAELGDWSELGIDEQHRVEREMRAQTPTRRVYAPSNYPQGYVTWQDEELPITKQDRANYLDQPMVGFRGSDGSPHNMDQSPSLWESKENDPPCATCWDQREAAIPKSKHDKIFDTAHHKFVPMVPQPGERRFAARQAPFGDAEDFQGLGWHRTHPDKDVSWMKGDDGAGFWHQATYEDDPNSPTGGSWLLNSFAGSELIGGKSEGFGDDEGYGDSHHQSPHEVQAKAGDREKQWLQEGMRDDKFMAPGSELRPVMIPSEDDQRVRGGGGQSKAVQVNDMSPWHPLHPMQRLNAKSPVYKGFIYLIQHEREIDLGARAIANPDDPDGDMSEQVAWWDIEHAKKNPALRKEVKTGTPWSELELWADKSVRTNKGIKEAFTRLAAAQTPAQQAAQKWLDENPEDFAHWHSSPDASVGRFDSENGEELTPESVQQDEWRHNNVRMQQSGFRYVAPSSASQRGFFYRDSPSTPGVGQRITEPTGWTPYWQVHQGPARNFGHSDFAVGMHRDLEDALANADHQDTRLTHEAAVQHQAESEYDYLYDAEHGEPNFEDEDEHPDWHSYKQDGLFPEGTYRYHEKSGRPLSDDAKKHFQSQKNRAEGTVAQFKQTHQNNPDMAPDKVAREKQLLLLGPEWKYSKAWGPGGYVHSAVKNVDGVSHHVTVKEPIWRGGPSNHEAVYHHEMIYPNGEVSRRYVGDINKVFDVAEGKHPITDDSDQWPPERGGRRLPLSHPESVQSRADKVQRIKDNEHFDPERHTSFPDASGRDRRRERQWDKLNTSLTEPHDFEAGSISGDVLANGDYQWRHYALPIGRAIKDPETGHRSIVMSSEGRDYGRSGGWGPRTDKTTRGLYDSLRSKGYHVKWDDDVILPDENKDKFAKAGFTPDGADYVRTSQGKRGNFVHQRIAPVLSGENAGEYAVETRVNGKLKRIALPTSKAKSYWDHSKTTTLPVDEMAKEVARRHRKYATSKCSYCDNPATKTIVHSEGIGEFSVCDDHLAKGKDMAEHCTPGGEHDPTNINSIKEASVEWWRYGAPLTMEEPRVQAPVMSGEDARNHWVGLSSGEWLRKRMLADQLDSTGDYKDFPLGPEDRQHVIGQAGQRADMEEFASKLGKALSHPAEEPIAPEAVRGNKASDQTPTVYVKKHPQFGDMENHDLPTRIQHVDTPRGKAIGFFHSVLGDGDKALYHNMGFVGDHGNVPVSIDHTHSSLPEYAEAMADENQDPDQVRRMRWNHEFGEISPFEHHFLGFDAEDNVARKKNNPLAPGDAQRAMDAAETMRPWAQSRGLEPWLDAAQKRMMMLGQRASGTESVFPYKMYHEQGQQRTAAIKKEAVTWVDHKIHPDCGCVVKRMKQMASNLPVQGFMVDHSPHGGRIRWKVTDHGVTQQDGKSRTTHLAEQDMLDAYSKAVANQSRVAARVSSRPGSNVPGQKVFPALRDVITAGKPEYSIRSADQVDSFHHDMITDSQSPTFYQEHSADPAHPSIYALRNNTGHTFLAPVTHNETGEDAWLRGSTLTDPSKWRVYEDTSKQLQRAISNLSPGAPTRDERRKRWSEQHEGLPQGMKFQEGDVHLDEEGHQLVEPRRDYWTEPGGMHPWDFDWDKPGDHPLTKKEDPWWAVR